MTTRTGVQLRKIGLTSNVLFLAGLASIGASFTASASSRQREQAGPTFSALGAGLPLEEERTDDITSGR